MLEHAKAIVAEFEEKYDSMIIEDCKNTSNISEQLMLYLSAKKYIERYG